MFDKNQNSCVKRIHLVTDDSLYDRKAFYTVKIVFYSSSMHCCCFLAQLLYIASKCQKQDEEEPHQLIAMNST